MGNNDRKPDDSVAGEIVGISPWAEGIRRDIRRVGAVDCDVLITGPTGTGKELIARGIHVHSPRAHRPFIPVDCAAFSGPLFAGHLFGHVQGAFTGANHPALGCFRAADGGTILLDEIGELEPEYQAKLLRVIQERRVMPLGGYEAAAVDVRVIAATNRDLAQMVAAETFREDLYYRLNVVCLQTTPLSERPEDIAPIAEHFLAYLACRMESPPKHLSPACLACLREQPWPGNARQLENFLMRAILMTEGDTIQGATMGEEPSRTCPAIKLVSHEPVPRSSLPRVPVEVPSTGVPSVAAAWPSMAEVERAHISRTLERTGFNQSAAASLLGMHRQQLVRKIKAHHISLPDRHRGRPKREGETAV